MDGVGQTELASAIIGPDAANKPVRRAIGNRDGFFFRIERHDDLYRAENFFLRQPVTGRHIADQRRQHIGAAFRRIGDQFALRGNGQPVLFRKIQIAFDNRLLTFRDDRPDRQVGPAGPTLSAR